MKWPLIQDGPGKPVSPGWNCKVVGEIPPRELNGTMSTLSMFLFRLRESNETTTTQWRTGGFPRLAVQISPRRDCGQDAAESFIEIHAAGFIGQRGTQAVLFS